MSYQVLARKYRPRSFDTLVGQEHVVRALSHALDSGRLHHAYLFTGTRGVGKTTLSRILAKAFNCIGLDGNGGITATPCGVCAACSAIDAGRFVDYIELDAASNRGVEEMAQLLEQAVYAPSNARFKVYMIDEVHMLTNHAFNAMLKTLEEPPEHVKFILATTDPQKIPVTVLSRCLQFNLKQMPPGHIVAHLDDILGQEGISFETPALRLLAQGAQGSMRDALSLTDQAIAYAAGTVTLDAVQGMLGALDQSFLIRLLDALATQDGAGLLAVADEMAVRSLSYNNALRDLGTLLHRLALAQSVPAALPEDLPERADIVRLAALFDAEEVQLFYQIAVHGRNELSLAPDEYAGFSMTLLRMLAFRPEHAGTQSASPLASSSATAATAVAPRAPARLSAAPAAVVSSMPVAPRAVAAASASATVPATAPLSPARAALEAARGMTRPNGGVSTPPPARVPEPKSEPRAKPVAAAPWEDNMPPMGEFPDDDQFEQAQKKTEPPLGASPPAPAPVRAAAPIPTLAPPEPVAAMVVMPVPELDWDGDWPVLAAQLPVRGVVQQLALQAELVRCDKVDGIVLHLRVPLETLASPANIDKLATALTTQFNRPVRVSTELGIARHTANAKANAERAAQQQVAEQQIQADPFVQAMMREFGATIVPGSIRPH
ncbi:DNA polymerase III subunit gamma/tau [Actimicrobium sp. CCI2.3]|uniref:DNA polymerase III subunit gamma/tau n=1 Tax=Actimicrobium sp. CCI2.3 TaxID=3048616 RepID=UPI002AB585B3|nr:DNA polymerase III subunit gamma/tau [Actimicrobium sp. CCI2.3]MDY7574054.1 DNA polymerase III subunit gamma/tau [Actimicrobium sp. CCI2.3]MEB0021838.1 DNA polymerase III subunit gamma/tau [Actimicrobium sp. CCI2.3]